MVLDLAGVKLINKEDAVQCFYHSELAVYNWFDTDVQIVGLPYQNEVINEGDKAYMKALSGKIMLQWRGMTVAFMEFHSDTDAWIKTVVPGYMKELETIFYALLSRFYTWQNEFIRIATRGIHFRMTGEVESYAKGNITIRNGHDGCIYYCLWQHGAVFTDKDFHYVEYNQVGEDIVIKYYEIVRLRDEYSGAALCIGKGIVHKDGSVEVKSYSGREDKYESGDMLRQKFKMLLDMYVETMLVFHTGEVCKLWGIPMDSVKLETAEHRLQRYLALKVIGVDLSGIALL